MWERRSGQCCLWQGKGQSEDTAPGDWGEHRSDMGDRDGKTGYDMGPGAQRASCRHRAVMGKQTVQKWEALRGRMEHSSVVVDNDGGTATGLSRKGEGSQK